MPVPCLLVIDDHEPMRLSLQGLLSASFGGYRVLAAGSAEEGLELAPRHALAAAVIDVNLPGLDGFEATRRLRDGHAGLPVVIVSMSVSLLARREALAAGALAMVAKSDAFHDLVPLLRAALSRKPGVKDS